MSEAEGGANSEQPQVLLGCAVGRLGVDRTTGELSSDLHQLLADSLSQQSVTPAKQARQHLRAILKKGAHKLQPGKRLRLRNDEDGYDVHIVSDRLEELSPPATLVFFVVTVADFNKYHNISSVLRDLKAATYTEVDGGQLGSCKAGSEATRQLLEPVFQRVALVYGHSPLATVEGKVAAVKQIMSASVARALHSVEHLEELEESSERFEEQSRQFHKKTVLVKKQHRKNYWVLGALAAVVLLAVILYFAIPAAIHSSSNSSPVSSSCSSTGMGA